MTHYWATRKSLPKSPQVIWFASVSQQNTRPFQVRHLTFTGIHQMTCAAAMTQNFQRCQGSISSLFRVRASQSILVNLT